MILNVARQGYGRATQWLSRVDLVVLLAVLAVVSGGWVFLEAAEAIQTVQEPGHEPIDVWLLRSLREPDNLADPIGPRGLEDAARDITSLGGYTVLSLLVAFVTGGLLASRRHHAALLLLASTLGGLMLSLLLKGMYARPRPDLVPHLTRVSTSSFPSGHAMLSAVVYLTLGALLARFVEGRWMKLYFLGAAFALTMLVGASRVYLGVHYPTDVLAGWSAGLAWAVLCWLAARYLQRRGMVERAV